jgi:hypothetical protein
MSKQTTPHTQTQQNVRPTQSDLEPDQLEQTSGDGDNARIYAEVNGAESGADRAPRKIPGDSGHHTTEPVPVSYEGNLSTRSPKGEGQGITSRSKDEESTRQEKVVKDRPDAEAGVNHSIS